MPKTTALVTKFDTDEVTRIYHDQYQRDSVAEQALAAYNSIAEVLYRTFHPKTAIDVGSGGGALVRGLRERGVDAVGLEGAVHAVELLPSRIYLHDLRSPLPETFDKTMNELTTSFDVAEHIEPEYADTFVDVLVSVTAPWGTIVLGPAPEGQDGLGHVNCQHPTYWIEKLEARGFGLFSKLSNEIRAEIKSIEGTNFLWWVPKNLMVFQMVGLSHHGRRWFSEEHYRRSGGTTGE